MSQWRVPSPIPPTGIAPSPIPSGLTPTGRHLPCRKDNANAITGENRPAGRKNSAVSRFI